MLLVISFLQVALIDIEDEDGACAAPDDAVLAVGTNSKLGSSCWDHQIVMFQSIQGRLRAHFNDLESVVAASSDELGAVGAEFQAGDLLPMKALDRLHLLLLV